MKAPGVESLSRDGRGAIATGGMSRSRAPPRSRGKDAALLSPDGCRATRNPSQRLAESGRERSHRLETLSRDGGVRSRRSRGVGDVELSRASGICDISTPNV